MKLLKCSRSVLCALIVTCGFVAQLHSMDVEPSGPITLQSLAQDQQNFFRATIKAIKEGNETLVKTNLARYPNFIRVIDVDGDTLLNKAVQADKLEIARIIVQKGANANIANNKGFTPLNNAVLNNNVEMVRLLIFHSSGGVDTNIANKDHNQTPLNNAVLKGNIEVVEMLLRNSANPNIANKQGFTPLNNAVIKGNPDMVRLLVEYKADKNIKNNQGLSAIDNARNKPQILELLK